MSAAPASGLHSQGRCLTSIISTLEREHEGGFGHHSSFVRRYHSSKSLFDARSSFDASFLIPPMTGGRFTRQSDVASIAANRLRLNETRGNGDNPMSIKSPGKRKPTAIRPARARYIKLGIGKPNVSRRGSSVSDLAVRAPRGSRYAAPENGISSHNPS